MISRIRCVSLLFIFFTLMDTSTAQKKHNYKPCKNLVLYFHDIIYNGHNRKNATSYIVAAPDKFNKTVLSTPFRFGDIVIFDDPITLDSNFHSKCVGRAQGMYLYDTTYTFTAWLGFSFVLNSTDHVGSINFVGADPILKPFREISVVGGTGDFFMHRGIGTLYTDSYEDDRYFRLKVEIKFYECW